MLGGNRIPKEIGQVENRADRGKSGLIDFPAVDDCLVSSGKLAAFPDSGNVSEWFFHGTLLSPAVPVWARKKQLPAAVKVMVDQSRVVAAYGCGGVIEGGEQVRTDILYFSGIKIKAAHHILDML